jgi:hemoglobin-like flavoprotein
MQARHITLVRGTFAQLAPIAPQAAALFYANLFEADPSLRALFRSDMQEQGDKLMRMIGAAVGLLDKPEQLLPVLQRLGERHAGYGVEDAHYATVGGALLRTLRMGLGEAFTAEVEDAWTTVYTVISSTMKQAASTATAVS